MYYSRTNGIYIMSISNLSWNCKWWTVRGISSYAQKFRQLRFSDDLYSLVNVCSWNLIAGLLKYHSKLITSTCTEITEINLSAFAYRQFHGDLSSFVMTNLLNHFPALYTSTCITVFTGAT